MSTNEHEMSITVKKTDDFGDWYKQVLTKGKFIEYYDISGCYVLLPNSYSIWENIQKFLDAELKKLGVKNAYFPLFISEKNLTKEKNHIEGFTPEVAWVTQAGTSPLAEKIAVRPTSECAMYPIFSNLVRSYNDLPLKMNQWCNVVRWEFSDCTPLIRMRNFNWQEGHTCYQTKEESMKEVLEILDLYKKTYNDLLSIPVIRGRKTENEKFAGADSTYSVESYLPVCGKGIQAATSHCLGQNFSKMFDITYQDADGTTKHVWQNSWGFTVRSIGITLMTHSDDKGAVIPPKVADIQVVIIPIIIKKRMDDILETCNNLFRILTSAGFRVKLDTRNHNPGWKFNYWETIGVPLRIEVGPKDVDKNTVTLCKRNTFEKRVADNNSNIPTYVQKTLDEIQQELYEKAHSEMLSHIKTPNNQVTFSEHLDNKNLCLIKWCGNDECAKYIKEKYKAKALCIPLDLNITIESTECCFCLQHTDMTVLFGRSF